MQQDKKLVALRTLHSTKELTDITEGNTYEVEEVTDKYFSVRPDTFPTQGRLLLLPRSEETELFRPRSTIRDILMATAREVLNITIARELRG